MTFIAQRDLDCFVDNLNLIDDILFQKVAKDPAACTEMLQTVLDDPSLTIAEVVPQRSLGNLVGRAVVVDALCTLGSGAHVAVEVQKRNENDYAHRTRYVRSSLDTLLAEKGINFKDVPSVTVVFASLFDPFKAAQTVYHVRKYIEETMQPVDDGAFDIYVNAAVDDGSKAARLMAYMADSSKANSEFPLLSKRVRYYKDSSEGRSQMGDLFEAYLEEHREQFAAEGHARGIAEGHAKGMAEGHAKGLAEGHAEGEIVGRAQAILGLMETLGLSAHKAMDAALVPAEDREAVMALVEKKIA